MILFLGLSQAGCGDGSGGDSNSETKIPALTGVIDTTAPSLLGQSYVSKLIQPDTTITIIFDESINTSSLSLGGNLAAESDGGVWSQTDMVNDTLTLKPITSWSLDTGRTLVVNAMDLAGNALPELTLSHDVYLGTLHYVSSMAMNDNGDGLSPLSAKRNIMAAVSTATPPATILVNAGDYPVSNTAGNRVELVEGISLYGGYNADFTGRTVGSSVVTDESSITESSETNPNYAMRCDTGLTTSTLVDGFTFQASNQATATYAAAIHVVNGAAPTIQNNMINGGNSAGSDWTFGMAILGSAPVIKGNTLTGGSGNSFSFGIYTNSSPAYVSGNTITGGNGAGDTVGIANDSSSPQILDNTIVGGNGSSSLGIENRNFSYPVVQGNSIHGGEGSISHAGLVNFESSPLVRSNTIHGGGSEDSGGVNAATGESIGIFNIFAAPIMENNTVNGGFSKGHTYGVYNDPGSPTIKGNTIYGGVSDEGASYGILLSGGEGAVEDNNIDAGKGFLGGYALYIAETSSAVNDNTFVTQTGTSYYCVYEDTTDVNPSSLQNNEFVSCEVLYRDFDTLTNLLNIDAVNALSDITGGVLGNRYSVSLP